MNGILSSLFAAISGFIASMGLGGGAVLIIFLSLIMGIKQFKAQGINLLFFVPVALFTTIINAYKKRIDYTVVLPVCTGGITGAISGVFFASFIGADIISRLFGAAILLLGLKEIAKGVKTMLASR